MPNVGQDTPDVPQAVMGAILVGCCMGLIGFGVAYHFYQKYVSLRR